VSKQAAQQKHTVRLSLGLNAPTFERFTPRARNVLSAAEPIARQRGQGHIDPEHLLLALYQEPEGVAAQILNESNLPLDEAEMAVGSRTERGPGAPEEKLSFTPKAIAVFHRSTRRSAGDGPQLHRNGASAPRTSPRRRSVERHPE
jgi:ATP-dependent Clp protease ATP-binding subunit ClpA